MTVQHDSRTLAADPAEDPSKAAQVAETAKSEASNVASTAVAGGRDVVAEAGTQVRAVASEAKQQVDRLVSQGRDELRRQGEERSSQAASQLHSLSDQFNALAQGRPDEAGPLVGLLGDAQQRVSGLASRLESGGPQGLLDDVTQFARRRPGLFLAGAVGIGFLVGRVVRAGAANQQDDQSALTPNTPSEPVTADRTVVPPLDEPVVGASAVPAEPAVLPPPVDYDPRTAP
jgi:hypothetical protein